LPDARRSLASLTILVTGFGPFPGAAFNPTGPLARRLARLRRPALAGVRLVPHVFATSYRAVDAELPALLSRLRPDAVLMFGLSGRAACLRIETRARNALATLTRDAEGRPSPALCIARGGPAALPFAVPAARLARAARQARSEAVTSRDAGRYLCNYLSWRAIEAAGKPGGPALVAFVHVPRIIRLPRRRGRRRVWRMADLERGGQAILLAAVAEAGRRRR
jgi:pyroglutamyl-peptidase